MSKTQEKINELLAAMEKIGLFNSLSQTEKEMVASFIQQTVADAIWEARADVESLLHGRYREIFHYKPFEAKGETPAQNRE